MEPGVNLKHSGRPTYGKPTYGKWKAETIHDAQLGNTSMFQMWPVLTPLVTVFFKQNLIQLIIAVATMVANSLPCVG